jgi:hypothetical protein
VNRPSKPRWWLDRRTIVAFVAAAGVITTAVYATSATTAKPQQVQAVANAQPASVPLLCDFPGLIQRAQQISPDPGTAVQQIKDALASCGIDVGPAEQFLRQVAADAAPQQVTADAKQFLVQQQGVAPEDFDQLQVEVQHVMEDPAQVGELAGGLLAKIGKYGVIIAAAIVVVVIALIIFGSSQQGKGKGKQQQGPDCGLTDADAEKYLQRIRPNKMTTGIGFPYGTTYDPTNTSSTVILTSGGDLWNPADPTDRRWSSADERDTKTNLAKKAAEILQGTSYSGDTNHAEQKMAVYMRLKTDGTITDTKVTSDKMCQVINNPVGMCANCIASVPPLLNGQNLTVIWKAKDGKWWHLPF